MLNHNKDFSLPCAIDGLTPLQRAIIRNMKSMKLSSKGKYQRSAIVVHECGGEYDEMYDHWICGSSKILYDSITNMTQSQTRHALIDGHGNFGSSYYDGNAAAPRFTEIKLSSFCEECMLKYYKQSKKADAEFFARVPGALIFGTDTIANGFVSKIPPHNLCEIIDAMLAMLRNPNISSNELLRYIKGPDFINGGIIVNKSEMAELYKKGQGRIRIRGKVRVETDRTGKKAIVVSEIPETMRGNVTSFVDSVIFLSEKGIIPGIEEVKDYTLLQTRIRIELKAEVNPEEIVELLFKKTDLEDEIECQFILTLDGVTRRMSLREIVSEHLKFYRNMLKNKFGEEYNDEILRRELWKIYRKYGKERKTEIIDI